jgi:ComF family protein
MRQLINHLFPLHCLLCDLPSHSESAICNVCYKALPQYKNNHDHLIALFDYEEPVSSLIWQLKFQGDLSIAQWFSQQFIEKISDFYHSASLPELIIPVPLHHERLKERGFNQAVEIAKPIAKHFHIPIDTKTCVRIKNTVAQSSLSARERRRNIKNAFGLSWPINAKRIAIIDDVITTGGTTHEIIQLLTLSGVQSVDLWVCARARAD